MIKGWDKLSTVRFRLGLMLGVGIILLVGYFSTVSIIDHHQEQSLFQSRLKSKQLIFDLSVNNASTQLHTFAYDYTYWDDMAKFADGNGQDTAFANENIDTGLPTYGANAVWVYNLKHRLIYSVDDLNSDKFSPKTVPPIQPDQMGVLFAKNGVYHYYADTSYGVFEIDAASIHLSNDPDRKNPAHGYFFVGKYLGKDYLGTLGKALEGGARVVTGPAAMGSAKSGYDIKSGKIYFGRVLRDYSGKPVAALDATYTAADLRDELKVQDKVTFWGVVVLSLLTLSLLLFLLRWVILPMGKVQKALIRGETGPAGGLMKHRDEFGAIARLIDQSFAQQKLLSAQKETVEREVTERTAQLRNEQQTLKTLLDSLPVGVFVASAPDGKPTMINDMGIQLLGRSIKPDTGWRDYTEFYDIIKEDGSPYPPQDLPLSISLHDGKRVLKDDVIVRQPDGNRVYLRIISAPIVYTDGEVRQAVAVFEDISKERELERSRDEFFSIASHELRTPLTAIRGNTSLIQQYYPEPLKDPDLHEMIDDIHESSVRLIEIVNDFLDTSRLEQKKVNFKFVPLDLAETAAAVIREYTVTSSRRKIHMEVIDPPADLPKVWADRDRTKQVIINLIGNSLKFTTEGSITLRLAQEGDFVKLFVQDTGQGMSEDAQKNLFHKFEQSGTAVLTRDSVRGTGLGLYISKLITEQMKGHIQLESSHLGSGTTFSFSLPTVKDEDAAHHPPEHDEQGPIHNKNLSL